ncbi:MAG: hypothetical protein ACI9MC_003564 [Kiritimatiellia bacterium]
MLALLIATAMASPNADVVVTRDIELPAAQVHSAIVDVGDLHSAWTDPCMRKWTMGTKTSGEGATFTVTYQLAAFRKKSHVAVSTVKDSRIEWDHIGNSGWVMRFKIDDKGDNTKLTVHTYLDTPPWPIAKYFTNKVHPAWVACQTVLVDVIAERAKVLTDAAKADEAVEDQPAQEVPVLDDTVKQTPATNGEDRVAEPRVVPSDDR